MGINYYICNTQQINLEREQNRQAERQAGRQTKQTCEFGQSAFNSNQKACKQEKKRFSSGSIKQKARSTFSCSLFFLQKQIGKEKSS